MDNAVYNNIKEDEPVNVGVPQVATGGAIISPTGSIVKGAPTVIPDRRSEIGLQKITVAPGESIQDAINAIKAFGGGTIFLKNGIHIINNTLVVSSSKIQIEGEDMNSTILDFNNSNKEINIFGDTAKYTTGTISVNNGSKTITGSLTVWTNNAIAGEFIKISNVLYEILSVDTDTQITLKETYRGKNLSGVSYSIANYYQNIIVRNITFQNQVGIGICLEVDFVKSSTFENLKFLTVNAAFELEECNEISVKNILFSDTAVDQFDVINCEAINISGNVFKNSNYRGVRFYLSTGCSLIGNEFFNMTRGAIQLDTGGGFHKIIGNTIENVNDGVGGFEALYIDCAQNTISGNSFKNLTRAIGFESEGTKNIIINNIFDSVTTNFYYYSWDQTYQMNVQRNNSGAKITEETEFIVATNVSGGTRSLGDVIILNASAVGTEFTTTITQGHDRVIGVVAESITNNNAGRIQTLGKTAHLKVNGTTAIAIGDFLGTFTTAGIAMKASAGDMCFAIALEAYAVADSNGIIDALLITPRLI